MWSSLIKVRISFDRLGETFNGLTMVGNGFDLALLKQVGIEKADAFCAVTNGDNTNLICAQVAKKIFSVPKVLARVYDPQRAHIYACSGLGYHQRNNAFFVHAAETKSLKAGLLELSD